MGFRASEGQYCKRRKGKPSSLAARWLGSCRTRAPPAPGGGVFFSPLRQLGLRVPSSSAQEPALPSWARLGLCQFSCPLCFQICLEPVQLQPAASVTAPGLGNRAGPFLISAAEGGGEEAAGYGCSGASILAAVVLCTPGCACFPPKTSISHAGPWRPGSSPPWVAGQAQWSVFSPRQREAAGWLRTAGRGREPLQSGVAEAERAARNLAPGDRGCQQPSGRAARCRRVCLGLDGNSRQHPQPRMGCICLSRLQRQRWSPWEAAQVST